MTLSFTQTMRHAMRDAVRATRGGDPAGATRIIQAALAAAGPMAAPDRVAKAEPTRAPSRPAQRRLIDPEAEIVDALDGGAGSDPTARSTLPTARSRLPTSRSALPTERLRLPLGAVVKALRDGAAPRGVAAGGAAPAAAKLAGGLAAGLAGGLARKGLPGLDLPSLGVPGLDLPGLAPPGMAPGARTHAAPPPPEGARFEARAFACPAGGRAYRLYVPASAPRRPRGLVLMLHGCTQNPDDFARGAAMNAVAEAHGLAVAYPAQTGAHNAQSCWNWFNPADQRRGAGEPAILAGIVQAVSAEFSIPPGAALVAGLSAGGAMAVVMGETYPELFAAVGAHSGLPYGAANDVISAFAAMRGEGGATRCGTPARAIAPTRLRTFASERARTIAPEPERAIAPTRVRAIAPTRVRTIVFHGAADATVHPSNAGRIIAAAFPGDDAPVLCESGRAPGGRAWTRTVHARPGAAPHAEAWLIEGAGHAWSGGHPGGSYTDPAGPDASAEMVRFFLEGLAPVAPPPPSR